MKAGCSIGEKPEGGGGEQAWSPPRTQNVPAGSFSLHLGSVYKCQTVTTAPCLGGCCWGIVGLLPGDGCPTCHHTFLPSFRRSFQFETQFQPWGEGLSAAFS